jgi:hypothetical protein
LRYDGVGVEGRDVGALRCVDVDVDGLISHHRPLAPWLVSLSVALSFLAQVRCVFCARFQVVQCCGGCCAFCLFCESFPFVPAYLFSQHMFPCTLQPLCILPRACTCVHVVCSLLSVCLHFPASRPSFVLLRIND